MTTDPAWTPTPSDLGAFAPATDEEAIAAATGVARAREDAEEAAALKLLTPLGRDVAAAAFAAGRQEVLDELRDLIGPAADTVNAASLMETLHRNLRGTALDFTPAAASQQAWLDNHGPRYADSRAAALVARCHRRHLAIVEAAKTGDQVVG